MNSAGNLSQTTLLYFICASLVPYHAVYLYITFLNFSTYVPCTYSHVSGGSHCKCMIVFSRDLYYLMIVQELNAMNT